MDYRKNLIYCKGMIFKQKKEYEKALKCFGKVSLEAAEIKCAQKKFYESSMIYFYLLVKSQNREKIDFLVKNLIKTAIQIEEIEISVIKDDSCIFDDESWKQNPLKFFIEILSKINLNSKVFDEMKDKIFSNKISLSDKFNFEFFLNKEDIILQENDKIANENNSLEIINFESNYFKAISAIIHKEFSESLILLCKLFHLNSKYQLIDFLIKNEKLEILWFLSKKCVFFEKYLKEVIKKINDDKKSLFMLIFDQKVILELLEEIRP